QNGTSFVETHRSNPNTVELGVPYPSNDMVEKMVQGQPLIDSDAGPELQVAT
ncbi:hypothetical protein CFSAN001630_16863, partial [Escherichia coli O111:H11 str. CFSAN001630]